RVLFRSLVVRSRRAATAADRCDQHERGAEEHEGRTPVMGCCRDVRPTLPRTRLPRHRRHVPLSVSVPDLFLRRDPPLAGEAGRDRASSKQLIRPGWALLAGKRGQESGKGLQRRTTERPAPAREASRSLRMTGRPAQQGGAGFRGSGAASCVGSPIAPRKSTVPENRSRIATRNGRSTRIMGGAEVNPTPPTVTAAAFVPASSTSTKVFCRTYWRHTPPSGVSR